jgi:hypothetical protein
LAAHGEPRMLADPSTMSRTAQAAILTFFVALTTHPIAADQISRKGEKKAGLLVACVTRWSGGSYTYYRRAPPAGTSQKKYRQNRAEHPTRQQLNIHPLRGPVKSGSRPACQSAKHYSTKAYICIARLGQDQDAPQHKPSSHDETRMPNETQNPNAGRDEA